MTGVPSQSPGRAMLYLGRIGLILMVALGRRVDMQRPSALTGR
jgi:hypothetical protein